MLICPNVQNSARTSAAEVFLRRTGMPFRTAEAVATPSVESTSALVHYKIDHGSVALYHVGTYEQRQAWSP